MQYGREEAAEPLIEQMSRDQDPAIRYGAMYAVGLAYRWVPRMWGRGCRSVCETLGGGGARALGCVLAIFFPARGSTVCKTPLPATS